MLHSEKILVGTYIYIYIYITPRDPSTFSGMVIGDYLLCRLGGPSRTSEKVVVDP